MRFTKFDLVVKLNPLGFTSDALLEEIMKTVGNLIWQAQRSLQEVSMLLEHIGRRMQERGETTNARLYLAKALERNQRATRFQRLAIGHESLSEESIEEHQLDASEADN